MAGTRSEGRGRADGARESGALRRAATVVGAEAPAANGGASAPDSYRAADLGSIRDVLLRLKQPIDPKFIKTREGWKDRQGNTHMVEYVEWHYVADLLDRECPEWEFEVRGLVVVGDMATCTAAITIVGYEPDGQRVTVTREGVGCGDAGTETGVKKAEHDALKRAAVKFGVARELYQRESDIIEKTGGGGGFGGGPGSDKPRDPLAKGMSDLVTAKQLGMLRARVREAGGDADEVCQHAFGCRTEELTKKAASWLIDNFAAVMAEAGDEPAGANGQKVPHCTQHGPAKYVEWDSAQGRQAAYVCVHRATEKDCGFAQRTEIQIA